MKKAKIIWVLGSEHLNAHKSIPWRPSFPNFSNCDVLIVNLQSLSETLSGSMIGALYNEARRYIFDMLMTQEKEVIVISSSNQHLLKWLPIYPIIKEIAPAKIGEYGAEPPIDEYLKTVEECSYYIHSFDTSYVEDLTNPKSPIHENYFFTSEAADRYELSVVIDNEVKNKAKQLIGGYFKFIIEYGWDYRIGNPEGAFVSGRIIFLPPPTRVSVEQAIDLIVNSLTGAELIESPPAWESTIELPGLEDIENKIKEKEEEKTRILEEIKTLSEKKNALIRFRRLLWTKGRPLENAVRDAFKLLGFHEIRKIREENLEDWVIEFKHVKDYEYGVFEVKGADQRTSLADLTQCNKWVEDYMLENKKAKGIFVTNQYRLENPSKNLKKREEFPKNEIEYAIKRDICILPTHEIFNVVIAKLKGEKIMREYIEEKIANAKGICKLL